ncbi:MAG: diguanylate cyclase [Spirochaetales bacterium]|nr:diguanylate cyclase [Spirochaetales bacterium]
MFEQFIEALEKDFAAINDPWEKIDRINKYLDNSRSWDTELSLKWIETGLKLGTSVGYERGIFLLLIHKVFVLTLKPNIKMAEEVLEQSKGLFAGEEKWPIEAAYFYHARGVLEMDIGLTEVALESLNKSVLIARKHKVWRVQVSSLNTIGIIYLDDGRFTEARTVLLKALDAGHKEEFALGYISVCNNLGSTYRELKEYTKSRKYLEYGIKKAEELAHSTMLSSLSQEMALLYEDEGNTELAASFYKDSIKYIGGIDYLTSQVIIDYGRFMLKSPDTAEEGIELLNGIISSLDGVRSNSYLTNALEILLNYYEENSMDNESLKIYRKIVEIKKDSTKLQKSSEKRQIERELSLSWSRHIDSIFDAGRMMLEPSSLREIFEIFRMSEPFIKSSPVALLAEKDPDSEEIKVIAYRGNKYFPDYFIKIDDPDSMIAYSMRTGRNVIVRDINTESHFFTRKVRQFDPESGHPLVQSLVCIPFEREGKQCLVSIQKYEINAYERSEINLLKGLITFLGIALDAADKNEKIALLSTRDPLTNLYNRREFSRLAERCRAAHMRSRSSFRIAILDLDHFKVINDKYGHKVGDDCLVAFSELLRDILRRGTDIYARYGGEEFIILFVCADAPSSYDIIEKIRKETEALIIDADGIKVKMTVSIGIAESDENYDLDVLIERADKAMYQAKERGRNRSVLARPSKTD